MAYDYQAFHEHGWARIRGVFSAVAAEAMRDAVWRSLERVGIERDRPSTWTVERPPKLRHLKADPVFLQVGSSALLAAIDAIFDRVPYEMPRNWGSIFLAFPQARAWTLPTHGWHIDAFYGSGLTPTRGVKTLALFGRVIERGGATLLVSGSHRLVHRWFARHPPPLRARSAELRRLLLAQPYLRWLHAPGGAAERIERFMGRVEEVDGIPLRVIEATGDAGDVILMHPLLMHVASTNNSSQPRFMLSGGVTTDSWGFQ